MRSWLGRGGEAICCSFSFLLFIYNTNYFTVQVSIIMKQAPSWCEGWIGWEGSHGWAGDHGDHDDGDDAGDGSATDDDNAGGGDDGDITSLLVSHIP